MGIFLYCSCISTIVGLHYINLNGKLDGNHTKLLHSILSKFWEQHPTKQQLYNHLPPISQTIQVRQTRQAGHFWKSKDELISVSQLIRKNFKKSALCGH